MKKATLILIILGFSFSGFSQAENKRQIKQSVILKSPKEIEIIDLLMQRDDIYHFCDNFYNFYYSEIKNTNKYYLVEKEVVRDSLRKYNAIKAGSIDLKLVLMNNKEHERVFVVPLH